VNKFLILFVCAQTKYITMRMKRNRQKTYHEYTTGTINGPKRNKEPTDKWKEQMIRQAANSKEVSEHNNVVKWTE